MLVLEREGIRNQHHIEGAESKERLLCIVRLTIGRR